MGRNNKTQEPENNVNNYETYDLENRKVISVRRYQNQRYYLTLDGEPFKGTNKNGEDIETNDISIDLSKIIKEGGLKHPVLNTFYQMANVNKGHILNPTIAVLCLVDTTISLKRVFKEKGEEIETLDGKKFDRNTWTSTITDIKPNINDFAMQMILLERKETGISIPNPDKEENKLAPSLADLLA